MNGILLRHVSFKLIRLDMHLNVEVTSMNRTSDGKWHVQTQDMMNGMQRCDQQFDAVVVAVDNAHSVAKFVEDSLNNQDHPDHAEVSLYN